MHRPRGRRAGALLPRARPRVRRPRDRDGRGARRRRRARTRCRRRSPTWAPRSAATARPGFLCASKALLDDEPEAHARRDPGGARRATSAAAPATSRSSRRSSARRPSCAARRCAPIPGNETALPTVAAPKGEVSPWPVTPAKPAKTPSGRSAGRRARSTAWRRSPAPRSSPTTSSLPRMLFAKLHRSHVAHAKIVAIDTSRGRAACPGVVAVLTGASMPIPFGILPVSQDEHALCIDRVRFVGDPVAAVAAIDEDAAFEAAMAIKVDYEPLQPIFSPEDGAREPRAPHPRLRRRGQHPQEDRAGVRRRREGLRARPTRSSRTRSSSRATRTCPMEQHATLAWMRPRRQADALVVAPRRRTTCTAPLSKVLGMPPSRDPHRRVPQRRRLRRQERPLQPRDRRRASSRCSRTGPSRSRLTREEVFYCHRGRHPVLMHFKTGVKKDGSITAMHFKTLLDGGAYGSYGVACTYYTGALQTVTYQVPHYRFDGVRVLHEQAALRPQARPRHAAAALRPGGPARQDRRRARPRPGRDAPRDAPAARTR